LRSFRNDSGEAIAKVASIARLYSCDSGGERCMTASLARTITIAFVTIIAMAAAQAQPRFQLIEATIDSIHAEMQAGRLTCTQLVQAYIDRIKAYDQKGPTLNAVQNISPVALKQAAELDAKLKASGTLAGPLHCIPVLVKDQFDTNFVPTTYGS